jgi:hypothetical protein
MIRELRFHFWQDQRFFSLPLYPDSFGHMQPPVKEVLGSFCGGKVARLKMADPSFASHAEG